MSESDQTGRRLAEEAPGREVETGGAPPPARIKDPSTATSTSSAAPPTGVKPQPVPAAPAAPGTSTPAAAVAQGTAAGGGSAAGGGIKAKTPAAAATASQGGGAQQQRPTDADKVAERRANEARAAKEEARQARAAEKRAVEALITKHRGSHNRARIAWAVTYYLLSFLSVFFAVATVIVLDLDSITNAAVKKDWATGFATAAAVAVILSLWLRHGQNARRHAAALPRLDNLSVELTRQDADYDEIRTELTAIISEHGGATP